MDEIKEHATTKLLKVYRTLFIDHGVNKADFCQAIGILQQNFVKFEQGKTYCTLEMAYRLRNTYGVSLEWLIMGDPKTDVVFVK